MPGRAAAPSPNGPAATAQPLALVGPRELVRAATRAGAAGAVQGGLLYGGTIAVLHALHNHLTAVDAVALLSWTVGLYGVAGAVVAAATMLVLRGARALRRGRGVGIATSGRQRTADRELWLALAAFNIPFWVLGASYGLTYDQSPSWVREAPAMLGWLVLRSVAVAAAALLLTWWLARGARAIPARWARALTAELAGVSMLAVVVIALVRPAPVRDVPPLPPAARQAGAGAKLVVIGVDGADWRVALPLVRAGRLPQLARLMREGSWGPLATFPGSNSAVIWASIYSGRGPGVHGVQDFYTVRLPGMDPEGRGAYPVHRTFFKEIVLRLQDLGLGELTPIDREHVDAPLLWEVAQAQGRSVGIVDGYMYSYPAPVLSVAGSYYVAYGADGLWQQAKAAGNPPAREDAARYATPPELIGELGELLARPDFAWQSAALLELLAERGQPALVSLYTHEPDTIQHASWRFHEPGRYFGVEVRAAAESDRIARFYEELDAFLGTLRQRLEPDSVLALVSDHGHSPTLFHEMDTQHRHGPPGILLLHGPGIRAGELASAHVLDVYPTLLHLLGIAVPEDAAGRVLDQALDPAYGAAHPVRRVASWDGLPRPVPAVPFDAARRRAELEKLRELGYIR